MKILKKTLALGVAVSALALAAPGFAQDVKFGFLGGFTGPIESHLPPIFESVKLAASHVNAQGGIIGGTLSFVSSDTTCADATAAANAADKQVNSDKVSAIVGALCSGATISAANNAAIPGNVVMISPASTSPSLTTLEDNDLVFRTTPSDAYQGDVLARLILSKGINEIAISYVNNDYGKGFSDTLAASFEKNGGKIAANAGHEDGKADYRAELGSLAATGTQNLVILAYSSGSGQTMLRQAIESGDFNTYIVGDGMVNDEVFTGIDTDAVEGMIASRPGSPEVAGSVAYAALATAANLNPTATFTPQSYDAAFMLALAVEKKGNADREGMSEALRSVSSAPGEVILPGEWEKAVALLKAGKDINYEGASGSHEFDAVGDVPGTIVEMVVKGGTFVEVGPAK